MHIITMFTGTTSIDVPFTHVCGGITQGFQVFSNGILLGVK